MQHYLSKTKKVGYFLGLSFLLLNLCPSVTSAGTPDDYGIGNQDAVIIESDTTWTKDQIQEITAPTYVVNGATLTIEAGTEVKFMDSGINYNNGSAQLIASDGTIKALGTEQEPVKFTGETLIFSLEFQRYDVARAPSLLRYVEIGDGQDEASDGGGSVGWLKNFVIPEVRAVASGAGSIQYWGGRATLENTRFLNKANTSVFIHNGAVVEGQEGDYIHISNSNFQDLDGIASILSENDCPLIGICQYRVKFQNNYYGRADGPDDDTFAGSAFGATYRNKPLIADPVIIVPGILGSALNDQGVWEIDPILHLYDDQIKSLEANGYTLGTNLFVMPYDWHKDNVITANTLESKIDDAKSLSGVSRVDIVAHSMGGLVARQYIQGDDYGDDVDQLITLGTPHRGSPESYVTWEGGDCLSGVKCWFLKRQLENESDHAGYNEIYKYIQEKTVSVGQLLPDYSYLRNTSDGSLREYPNATPRNEFLENLNSQESISNLSRARFSNFIGRIEEPTTAVIARVGDASTETNVKWAHGFPQEFDNKDTDQGLTRGIGDGTVPLASVEYPDQVVAEKILNATHTALPKVAQCEVLETFTAKTDCQYVDEWDVISFLRMDIFSPIDVQVVSPSGERVGKDFETGEILSEIPGAFYSGYETDVEFVTIPNPEDGEYRILTEGIDEGGSYRVEATSIEEDPATRAVTESQVTFTGTAIPDVVTEEPLTILDEAIVLPEDEEEISVDITAPVITLTTPTAQEYGNNMNITPVYTVTDETSTEDKVVKTLTLDGATLSTPTIDLSLLALSNHTFTVTATDEAGNTTTAEVVFTSKVSWVSLRQNATHYQALGLIKYGSDTLALKARITSLELLLRAKAEVERLPRLLRARALVLVEKEILKQQGELTQFLNQRVQTGRIDVLVKSRILEGIDVLM